MRSAAAPAHGAKAPANTSNAPSKRSCGCPPMPAAAASAEPAPIISTGTYKGSTSSESKAPPPRRPNVSAAPIAPIKLRTGVPKAKDSVSTPSNSWGKSNCSAKTGEIRTRGRPETNQWANTLAATVIPRGVAPSSICSSVPSEWSDANIRCRASIEARSAATQMTPGAIVRRSAGSGPIPRGKRLTTITKKRSTVMTSELRRAASRRSRWITHRSAASMSAPPEIDTQCCGDPGLEMRRENHCCAPGEVLRDQILHVLHSGGVERRKRLIQDPQRHRFAQGQARERDAPPLALRQHPRRQILATAEAELAKRLAEPRGLHWNAGERARNAQILGRSQVILDRAGVSDLDGRPPELLLQPPHIL